VKRREFIERILAIGGLSVIQPWQLVALFGTKSFSDIAQQIEDWDVAAEAGSLARNNIQSYGTKLFDSNNGNSSIAAHGVGLGDAVWAVDDVTTPVYVDGSTKSLRVSIVSPGSVVSAYDLLFDINVELSRIGKLLLPVYPTFTGGGWLSILSFGQEVALTNRFEYSYTGTPEQIWFDNVRLRNEPTSTVGSPVMTNTFVRLRLRIQVAAGVTGAVHIGSLYANPQTTTRIAIGFDDRNVTEFTNTFEYMRDRQIPGYSCAISAFGTLTVDQMQQMVAAGWSIHNHTRNHLHMTTLSTQQQLDELLTCRSFLQQHKLHNSGKNVFVYPFNDGNTETDDLIAQYYPQFTRAAGTSSGIWGFSGKIIRDQSPTRLLRRVGMDNPNTSTTVLTFVNRWMTQGVDGIILGHNPIDGANPGHTELSEFKLIIDTLHQYRQAGLIRCVNMDEMIIGLQRTRYKRVPLT